MADNRGGARRPKAPQPPGGPGRFSRRTDANQPLQAPDLDNPDVNYGEVAELQEAQRRNPLPRGVGTRVTQGMGQATSEGARPPVEALPPFLTELPSARSGEPAETGLPFGPGAGPEALRSPPEPRDDREAVLQYLATGFNNADAAEMLAEYRAGRPAAPVTPALPGGAPPPETPTLRSSLTAAQTPVPSDQLDPGTGETVDLGPPLEEEGSLEEAVSLPGESPPDSESSPPPTPETPSPTPEA